MIEEITIHNFKSIVKGQLQECKRINVLFGPPNGGKSNVLEALSVFSLSQWTGLERKRLSDIIRFENVPELFFDGRYEFPIDIEAGKDYSAQIILNDRGGLDITITNGNNRQKVKINRHLLITQNAKNEIPLPFKKYAFSNANATSGETMQRLSFYTSAMAANKNALIILDNPDAQIYPAYISEMVSKMAAHTTNQYILSTQSVYLINQLVKNHAEDTALYYVSLSKGETHMKRVPEQIVREAYLYGVDWLVNSEIFAGDR